MRYVHWFLRDEAYKVANNVSRLVTRARYTTATSSFHILVYSRYAQVRCDAASLGVPCTNCVAFSIECKIPTPRRKKTGGKKDSERCDSYPSWDAIALMEDEQ